MKSLALALIFRYFLRQLLSLAVLRPAMSADEKTSHLTAIDVFFVATVLIVTHRDVFRDWLDEMLLVGISGMCHVSFLFFAVGSKCVSMLYLFAFMLAIGPVFTICVIVDREIGNGTRFSFFLASCLCFISSQNVSFPMVFCFVSMTMMQLVELIEGQIALDEDVKLLRKLRRKLRLLRQKKQKSGEQLATTEQNLRANPTRVHHFPKTVSKGLYRNDGQARCHPVTGGVPTVTKTTMPMKKNKKNKKASSFRGFEIVSHE